ncbi:hypothetical protein MHBO_004086 [Bonamia ostreae]|uniref:Uncharacterized protein n=1 Tax=Bonamia ostreae TaxID=126728 RepID=A0ABV2ASF8_9EUKA
MVPLPLNSEGLPVNDNLRMFGLVKNRGAIKRGTTLCEDVSETLNWFASIGLPHTPFHVKKYDEFKAIKGMLKEGFVLHYQIKSGRGGYVTIGVEKHKIWWYIVLRLLREFMRHRRNVFSRRWSENLWTRLEDRNKSYMDMSAGMLRKWYKLLCKFVRWFFDRKYEKHMNLIGFESGSLGMGTMWREFLFDYPEIDDSFGVFVCCF